MKIITDEIGRVAIESLCHSAMANCPREGFVQNLAFVTNLLNCIEVETPEPPKPAEEPKPDEPGLP